MVGFRKRRFGARRFARRRRTTTRKYMRRGRFARFKRKRGAFRRGVQKVVMGTLTADNSIITSSTGKLLSSQGGQFIYPPSAGLTAGGSVPGPEVMMNPRILDLIAQQIQIASVGTTKFTVKNYTIKHSMRNGKNVDVYIDRYRCTARSDIPISAYTDLGTLVTQGFADNNAMASPLNTPLAHSVWGVTPYQNPQLTSACRIKYLKTYHLLPGQEVHYTRKRLRPKDVRREHFNPGHAATSPFIVLRGQSFEIYCGRGGLINGTGDLPSTTDAIQLFTNMTVRVHYSWIQDASNAAGATYPTTGGGTIASPTTIVLNNPAAPVPVFDN